MARKSKLNAGVIGLGIIGSRIADNLRKAGFQVFVWNRTPKPAPNFLASPAEVAGICDVVQIVVADSVALSSILEAMKGVLTSRHTIICSATVGARATLEAAQMVEAAGAQFLDAPFTGSKGAAEKGELVYYIGGTGDAFRRAEPVLKATSKAIVKIGATGEAATIKIATNMLAAVTVQTLVEACALIARSGIDPAVLLRALEHHGVRSGLSDMKLPKIVAGDFDTNFSVKHMFKDVQLAIQEANRHDIDIPATTATAGSLYNAIHQGWADLDFAALAKFYDLAKPAPPAEPTPLVPVSLAPTEPPPSPLSSLPAAKPEPETAPSAEAKISEPEPDEEKPAEASTIPIAPVETPATELAEPPKSVVEKEEALPEADASAAAGAPIELPPPPARPVAAEKPAAPAPSADKPKKMPPPFKPPQKKISHWFGSGRK